MSPGKGRLLAVVAFAASFVAGADASPVDLTIPSDNNMAAVVRIPSTSRAVFIALDGQKIHGATEISLSPGVRKLTIRQENGTRDCILAFEAKPAHEYDVGTTDEINHWNADLRDRLAETVSGICLFKTPYDYLLVPEPDVPTPATPFDKTLDVGVWGQSDLLLLIEYGANNAFLKAFDEIRIVDRKEDFDPRHVQLIIFVQRLTFDPAKKNISLHYAYDISFRGTSIDGGSGGESIPADEMGNPFIALRNAMNSMLERIYVYGWPKINNRFR